MPHDHEGRSAMRETFPDIGAQRFLAHGVQAIFPQHAFQLHHFRAGWQACAYPWRLGTAGWRAGRRIPAGFLATFGLGIIERRIRRHVDILGIQTAVQCQSTAWTRPERHGIRARGQVVLSDEQQAAAMKADRANR